MVEGASERACFVRYVPQQSLALSTLHKFDVQFEAVLNLLCEASIGYHSHPGAVREPSKRGSTS